MKKFFSLFLILGFSGGMSTVHAQNDICKIEDYVKGTMDNETEAHMVFLHQCRKNPFSNRCQFYRNGFVAPEGADYVLRHHLENCRYNPTSLECELFLYGNVDTEKCCRKHPGLCDTICKVWDVVWSDYAGPEDNGNTENKKDETVGKENGCKCDKEFEKGRQKGYSESYNDLYKKRYEEGYRFGESEGHFFGFLKGAIVGALVPAFFSLLFAFLGVGSQTTKNNKNVNK